MSPLYLQHMVLQYVHHDCCMYHQIQQDLQPVGEKPILHPLNDSSVDFKTFPVPISQLRSLYVHTLDI